MAQTPDLVIPAQAGIGTIQCERTRAMSKHVRFLLLVTNYQIATCQGNAMDPDPGPAGLLNSVGGQRQE